MEGKLLELVSSDAALVVVICFLLLLLFWIKEGPDIKDWINRNENTARTLRERDESIEGRVAELETFRTEMLSWKVEINDKVGRDYNRINNISRDAEKMKQSLTDSLEEREILMRATLSMLRGLHELGVNGPTTASQNEIEDYLSKKAHRSDE